MSRPVRERSQRALSSSASQQVDRRRSLVPEESYKHGCQRITNPTGSVGSAGAGVERHVRIQILILRAEARWAKGRIVLSVSLLPNRDIERSVRVILMGIGIVSFWKMDSGALNALLNGPGLSAGIAPYVTLAANAAGAVIATRLLLKIKSRLFG